MSASLCWCPVPKRSSTLSAMAPQHTMDILEEIGIEFPGEAGQEHLSSLRALSKSWPDQKHNPFADLVNAIEEHNRVRLWAEY